jgi:hypothetical protein
VLLLFNDESESSVQLINTNVNIITPKNSGINLFISVIFKLRKKELN